MRGLKGDPGNSISAPKVFVSPERKTVTENQTAIFYCSANGNPKPDLTWKKINGYSAGGKVLRNLDRGKLEIRNSTSNDSGRYICTGVNALGRDWKIVELIVEGKMDSEKFMI